MAARSKLTEPERFMSKVAVGAAHECWLWTGNANPVSGYGQFRIRGRNSMTASRAAWTLLIGEVPDGLDVCHSCDNRRCVNPAHLWLGTRRDNMLDAKAKGRIHVPALKASCKRGHPRNFNSWGCCRDCARERYHERKVAA